MKDNKHNLDLSIQRRKYYSDKVGLTNCPECNAKLIDLGCPVLLVVKSGTKAGEFMTSLSGSHFCLKCPVVIFDTKKLKMAAELCIRGGDYIEYFVKGIIDLDAIPKEKSHLEIGTEENPMPLVPFLPDLPSKNNSNRKKNKKTGRNDPCPCGSGKKYKKCCEKK